VYDKPERAGSQVYIWRHFLRALRRFGHEIDRRCALRAAEIAEQSGKLDHYWTHVEKISLRRRSSLLGAARELSGK
jgi:hypothetical protein